jgi:hypothetical protein
LFLQVQLKFRQEITCSLIRSASSHFLLLFWFRSDILPCSVMNFHFCGVVATDMTNVDPQSATTGRVRAQGGSVGHGDGLPLGSSYDANGQGDGSQHDAAGNPNQSFRPPRPTATIQTKKKGIEVL